MQRFVHHLKGSLPALATKINYVVFLHYTIWPNICGHKAWLLGSINEIGHWCWIRRYIKFSLIPNTFIEVEVRALCKSWEFFHCKLGKAWRSFWVQLHCHDGTDSDFLFLQHTKTSIIILCYCFRKKNPHIFVW